jgi:hypothetical protein
MEAGKGRNSHMRKGVHITEAETFAVVAFLAGIGVTIVGSTISSWVGWILIAIAVVIGALRIRSRIRFHRQKTGATDLNELTLHPPQRTTRGHAGGAYLEAMELANRLAWANHFPPVETSRHRVRAEAKAIIRKLDERLVYLNDALEGRKTVRDWRSKIGRQRVNYATLDNDKLVAMTNEERELVRIAVSDLADLDGHVSETLAKPRLYPAEQVAWMYKHRADKARSAVQNLITLIDEEDQE